MNIFCRLNDYIFNDWAIHHFSKEECSNYILLLVIVFNYNERRAWLELSEKVLKNAALDNWIKKCRFSTTNKSRNRDASVRNPIWRNAHQYGPRSSVIWSDKSITRSTRASATLFFSFHFRLFSVKCRSIRALSV